MDIARIVGQLPLFKGLPEKQTEEVVSIASYKSFKRGELIFSEGDEAAGLYVVVVGRVKIFKVSPEGKEQVLHIIGFQEPFGEVAVFAGERFPANAEALDASKVLFVPRTGFMELIKEDPSLAMNMLAILSVRLRQFTRMIEELSLKEVPGRLASYLVYLSDRERGSAQLEIDIPKNLLANVLGTIPETLSRILARMGNEGLIRVEGRRITLLDRRALEEVASGSRSLV